MSGKAAADGKAARPSVSGRKRADGGRSAGRGTAGKRRLWPRILALVVAVLVLAMVAVFSWNRWLRFDDARDFQGSWQMAGAASAVAIDGDVIRLTEDVAYAYRLDPGSKTLSFTFGTYSGKGRYRFSLDRQTLVIQDGDFSWFSTLTDDAVWTFQALVAAVQGGEPPLPEGDDVVVLVRSAPVPPSGDAAGGSAEDPVGDAGGGDGAGSSDPSGGSGGSVTGADPAAGASSGAPPADPTADSPAA